MPSTPRLGPLTADQAVRVRRLRRELAVLEERYSNAPSAEVARLDRALGRRTSRIDVLSEQLDTLVSQLVQLETERAGLLAGLEMVLDERITEIRDTNGEAWSPWPVLAYRRWGVARRGLVGMIRPWTGPQMEASCDRLSSNEDLPHTDDRCGEPPCGIYALKTAEAVVPDVPADVGWAIGLVGLSGKVVEHDHGYRAQRADVLAIVVHSDGKVLAAEEPRMVGLTFQATAAAVALLGRPREEWPTERTLTTLAAAERRLRWTSDQCDG